jgi:flagellar protein FliO/FliZ
LILVLPVSAQENDSEEPGAQPADAQNRGAPAETSRGSTHGDTGENPEKLILIDDKGKQDLAQTPVVSTWDFVKMLLVLGGVVGLIYLLFLLLRRGARNRYPENQLIRMLDYQSLSGSRALHLVEVANNVYLVGSAENGVNLISEITDKESLDTIRLELSQKPTPQRRNFSDVLVSLFKSSNNRGISAVDSINFMKQQKDRLKKLR